MRIESFWAKGYRSLRDVQIGPLGPFNVFYGPNGSGKSNLLSAIRLLVEILRIREIKVRPPGESYEQVAKRMCRSGLIAYRDLYARDDARTIVLGAHFVSGEQGKPLLASGPVQLADLVIEFRFEWIVQSAPHLFLTRLESGGKDLRPSPPNHVAHLHALLFEELPARAYTLVDADRFLGGDRVKLPKANAEDVARGPIARAMLELQQKNPKTDPEDAAWHPREGGLAEALLRAHIDSRPAVRQRLEGLRTLLQGSPLHRPPFYPVQDAKTGAADLHERLPEPNPNGVEISVELAGLGVAQIYVILAQAMLSGARAVAIEEPEAHLHAPTSGLHLRQLLHRLVDEHHLDQLFIATHSNLFDLDPEGYWDVSLVDGETRVERRPLHEIDARHLYEPGPAKHALAQLLRYAPAEEIVFRRPDGSPVSAQKMLDLLQVDDETAVDFLRTLHGAALRVVRLDSRRKEGGK